MSPIKLHQHCQHGVVPYRLILRCHRCTYIPYISNTYIHTYIHTGYCAYMIHTHTYIYIYIPKRHVLGILTFINPLYIHTTCLHIHTYNIHTYIHTYIRTYTHTYLGRHHSGLQYVQRGGQSSGERSRHNTHY